MTAFRKETNSRLIFKSSERLQTLSGCKRNKNHTEFHSTFKRQNKLPHCATTKMKIKCYHHLHLLYCLDSSQSPIPIIATRNSIYMNTDEKRTIHFPLNSGSSNTNSLQLQKHSCNFVLQKFAGAMFALTADVP